MASLRSMLVLPALLWFSLDAHAAILTLESSQLEIHFNFAGSQETLVFPQSPASLPVFVSSGGGSFAQPGGLFAGTGSILLNGPFTKVFTGLTYSVSNAGGSFAAGGGPGGGFGGSSSVTGQLRGLAGYLFSVRIPLAPVGVGGVAQTGAATLRVTVTGASGWTAGTVTITAITVAAPGGFANTVTFAGKDDRDAGHRGELWLVTPIRVFSNATTTDFGFAVQKLLFVPEPGIALLFGMGAVGLVVMSRRRS